MYVNPRMATREAMNDLVQSALPCLGGFAQPDPLGYQDDPNLYAYTGNDPVNVTDPSGLTWVTSPLYKCAGYDWNCAIYGYRDVWIPDLGGGPSGRSAGDPSCGIYWRACRDWDADPTTIPKEPTPQKNERSTWANLKACTAAQYGFGDGSVQAGLDLAKIASEVGQIRLPKSLLDLPIPEGSSRFTNVLNYSTHLLGYDARFAGQGARLTRIVFSSVRVGTVLGRANLFVGGALLAYDVASIAVCTAKAHK